MFGEPSGFVVRFMIPPGGVGTFPGLDSSVGMRGWLASPD